MNSLRHRLLIAGTLILILFCVVVVLALDRAFRASALEAQEERMQGMIYSLLGSVDTAPGGALTFNELALQDQHFFQKDSGLAAMLLMKDGRVLWKSPSWPKDLSAAPAGVETGEWLFTQTPQFRLAFGVNWVLEGRKSEKFTITLDQNSSAFDRQLHTYHVTVLRWLLISVVLLLFSLAHILRWGIKPLRNVVAELDEIRAGRKETIERRVPDELKPLTDGLNSLLRHERSQQKRFRNSLDDLAHSLKNPLAAMKSFAAQVAQPAPIRGQLSDQIDQMGKILDYQVRRASAAGRTAFTQPISVRVVTDKVISALEKVYRDKEIHFATEIDGSLRLALDEGDLMEVIGNLLDNASKWCKKSVRVCATIEDRRFTLTVEDDGPGFPKEDRDRLMERGVRADLQMPGQGIGLSVVREIATLYGGALQLGERIAGGGRVSLEIPI